MADSKKLLKYSLIAIGILGAVMVAVSAWAMAAPYTILGIKTTSSDAVGDSAKLAVSAGVFAIVISIAGVFANLDNKMHLYVITAGFLLIIALSIAAMSIAIKDINSYKPFTSLGREFPFVDRMKGIAAVSGISAVVQIIGLILVGTIIF